MSKQKENLPKLFHSLPSANNKNEHNLHTFAWKEDQWFERKKHETKVNEHEKQNNNNNKENAVQHSHENIWNHYTSMVEDISFSLYFNWIIHRQIAWRDIVYATVSTALLNSHTNPDTRFGQAWVFSLLVKTWVLLTSLTINTEKTKVFITGGFQWTSELCKLNNLNTVA